MKRIIPFTMILIALTACTLFRANSEPAETEGTQVNMPNPASVNCTQQGNKHEIRTAADGSQSGVCIFPDGSACDEWAYYRGECGPAAQPPPTPAMIIPAPTDASDPGGESDQPGSSMPPGSTEVVADWWGVIQSTGPGAQFDDYFVRQDLGQEIILGIDSLDPAVKAQIVALRDSGKIVHLYGALVSNVPDVNGSQIIVERIEIEE